MIAVLIGSEKGPINRAEAHYLCSSMLYAINQSIDEPNVLSMNSKSVNGEHKAWLIDWDEHSFFRICLLIMIKAGIHTRLVPRNKKLFFYWLKW